MLTIDVVIPAKSISRRCPNKNWRQLPFVPFKCCLTSIALHQACEIAQVVKHNPDYYGIAVDRVIVTTDHPLEPKWWWQHRLTNKIAPGKLRYHQRQDRHPNYEEDTWKTVSATLETSNADWVVVLQPTNPLRTIVGWDVLQKQLHTHHENSTKLIATFLNTRKKKLPLGTWYAAKVPIALDLANLYKQALTTETSQEDIVLLQSRDNDPSAIHIDINTEDDLMCFAEHVDIRLKNSDMDPRRNGWLHFLADPNIIE